MKHKRLVSFVAIVAFCLTMLAPVFVAPSAAVASATYTATSVQNVINDTNQKLGKIKITIDDVDALTSPTDMVSVLLPSGVTLSPFYAGQSAEIAGDIDVATPATVSGDDNPLAPAGAVTSKMTAANSFDIVVHPALFDTNGASTTGIITVDFVSLKVVGQSGDITASFIAPSGSGFTSGAAVIGRVDVDGGTQAMALSVKTISKGETSAIDTILIAETVKNSIKSGTVITYTLPSGFKWKIPGHMIVAGGWNFDGTYNATGQAIAGSGSNCYTLVKDSDRKLSLTVTSEPGDHSGAGRVALGKDLGDAEGAPTDTFIQIIVPDSAANGDVTVDIAGGDNEYSEDISDSSVVVAKVGDYGTTVTEGEKLEVVSGMKEQKLGYFYIEESLAGSLIYNRSVKFTLPDGCKWDAEFLPETEIVNTGGPDKFLEDNDDSWEISNEGRTITQPIYAATEKAEKLKIKNAKIQISPAFSGPVTLTISGTAGLTGEVAVADCKKAVEFTAASVKNIILGLPGQPIDDLFITETLKGNIMDNDEGNGQIKIKLESGYSFSEKPVVTVAEGNLEIDTYKLDSDDANNDTLIITVDSYSGTASKIKISGVKLTALRYVPEGPVKAKLVADLNALDETDNGVFDPRESAGSLVIANCVTPAPIEQGRTVIFYIGSTVMTVNGSNVIMDAAPYVKSRRTFVPVRYLADGLGATTAWDAATQTVTITKGDKTIVLTIGSLTAKVNGADVALDVAPEITGGRTMLPARAVAEALGYQVGWNAALQQVVIQ